MRKKVMTLKNAVTTVIMGMFFLLPSLTVQAAHAQMLPDTGEEIAKTGAIIGGIILIIVVLIILFRRKKDTK